MTALARTAARLSRLSRRGADPEAGFDWGLARADRLALPEALLSLAGTPELAALDDAQRARLAVLELVRFFSLNVAGEARLLRGLEAAANTEAAPTIRGYLGEVIREERAHTAVFLRFCNTFAGHLYPDRQVVFPRDRMAGEAELVFFAEALLFEEISMWWNRRIAECADVWALSRAINAYHAEDEARHIAYGRASVAALWEQHAPSWGAEGRARVASHLRGFIDATMSLYVEPAVYRDAALPGNVYALRRAALASPSRRALEANATRRARAFVDHLAAA